MICFSFFSAFMKKNSAIWRCSFLLIITFVLVFACGFGFLAALNAGALVILLLAKIRENAGLCTAAFETLQCAVQGFVFLDVNFRHLYPSLHCAIALKGPIYLAF